MHVIPRSQLSVPENRIRRSFPTAHINSLAGSITRNGLLHPIVVRPSGSGWNLVCGECRLRAIDSIAENSTSFLCNSTIIDPGSVPVIFANELSPAALKEAELEENLLRRDLSWQDRDRGLAELHALRQAANPEQTVVQTAREVVEKGGGSLNATQTRITRAQVIARNLHRPEVAAARNSHEALQIITRGMEAEFAEALASRTSAVCPHTFHEGDARVVLPQLPPLSFDTILADPPYAIGADDFGSAGTIHTYDDSPDATIPLWLALACEGFRIAKPQATLFLFCDIDWFVFLKGLVEKAGWKPFRTPLIWCKGNAFGNAPWPGAGPRRTHELILFASKGNRQWTKQIADTIVDIPQTATGGGHAAAKPVALYSRLLSTVGLAGDSVLDPCCGSGTIFPAATALRMKALGIESDPASAQLARGRLSAVE